MAYTDLSRILLQGVVSAAPRDFNGARTGGYRDLGQVDLLTIDPKPKYEDIMDSRESPAGTIDHILTEIDFAAKIRMLDGSLANWALANYADYAGTVTGASVVGEAITLYNGMKTPLANPGVSSVVIAGAVLDTDYTINAASGTINVLKTSPAAPDGSPLVTTVSYDFATYNGVVQAFTVPQRYFSLRLEGINVAQGGQPIIVDIWQWTPDPVKVLNLLDKKKMELELDGKMLKDESIVATGVSRYYRVMKA